MRVPPILIALAIAVVLLAVAIVLGLTVGQQPLPHCTPGLGVQCETPTLTPVS